MSTVEIETGRYVKRWAFWNPATWSIPKLYWDAWSQEQRIHAICRQLEKVIKYADYLGVNVDDIAARLKAIEDGQLDELITQKIEEWFEENEPEILQAIENLQTNVANIVLEIGTGFDAENTIADAIAAETQARTDADTELENKIDKFEKTFIPGSIEAMEIQFRKELTGLGWQGGCAFEYNNALYFAILTADGYADNTARHYIKVYNSEGLETASLEITYEQAGHAQNATYLDGKLYVSNMPTAYEASSFSVFNLTPYEITFDTYQEVPGQPRVFDATLDSDNYYLVDNNNNLVSVDRTTGDTMATTGLAANGVPNGGNGLFVWEKYDAVCVNNFGPNQINLFNRKTLEHIGAISVRESYGYAKIFEPQWITIIGDYDLYMGVNPGYNFFSVGQQKSDIAPYAVMHTNTMSNIGMDANHGDVQADFSLTQETYIYLDYENAEANPVYKRDFNTNVYTLKYAQDVDALIRTLGLANSYYIRIDSEYPGVLTLVNYNGFIVINAPCWGVVAMGGNLRIGAGNTAFVDNSSKWAYSSGITLQRGLAFVNMDVTNSPSNFMTALHELLICPNAIWSKTTKSSSVHLTYTT